MKDLLQMKTARFLSRMFLFSQICNFIASFAANIFHVCFILCYFFLFMGISTACSMRCVMTKLLEALFFVEYFFVLEFLGGNVSADIHAFRLFQP